MIVFVLDHPHEHLIVGWRHLDHFRHSGSPHVVAGQRTSDRQLQSFLHSSICSTKESATEISQRYPTPRSSTPRYAKRRPERDNRSLHTRWGSLDLILFRFDDEPTL